MFKKKEKVYNNKQWKYFSVPEFTRYVFKINLKDFLEKNKDMFQPKKENLLKEKKSLEGTN